MPSLQVVDLSPTPDPDKGFYRNMGAQFGEALNKYGNRKNEDDVVKRLVDKYQPGVDKNQYLRETLSMGGNVPLEKRVQIFEALSGLESEEAQRKKDEEAIPDYAEALGTTKSVVKSMTAAQRASALNQRMKVTTKANDKLQKTNDKAVKEQENADASETLLSDPNFTNWNEAEFVQQAKKFNVKPGSVEYKRLSDIRNANREYTQLNAKDRYEKIIKPRHDTLKAEASTARKRLDAGKQLESLYKTGKAGPENVRNFFAKLLPEGSFLGDMIRTPEDRFVDTLSYQYIVGTKNDFGVRLTDADLLLVQNKVISSVDTKKSAEYKLKYFNAQDRATLARERATDKVLDKYYKMGQVPPLSWESEVREELAKDPNYKKIGDDLERSALDVMALDNKGESQGVWMVDPDTDEKYLIGKDQVSEHEKAGAKRL